MHQTANFYVALEFRIVALQNRDTEHNILYAVPREQWQANGQVTGLGRVLGWWL